MRIRILTVVPHLMLALGLLPASAWAWKQTQVSSGCGERWLQTHLTYGITKPGLDGVPGNGFPQAIADAFLAWQQVSCSLCATGLPNQAPQACAAHPVGFDVSLSQESTTTGLGPGCVVTQAGKPCQVQPNGNFVVAMHDQWPFGASVVSTTVVTANLATGEIVDADIALDDLHHDFCTGTCKPGQFDLCSTLTHEAGHFLGLDHSLEPDATMYASAPAQENQKCSLEQDDRDGLCTAYTTSCNPAGLPKPGQDASGADAEPGGKTPAPSGCCTTRPGSGGPRSLAGLGTVLLAGLVLCRRRTAS